MNIPTFRTLLYAFASKGTDEALKASSTPNSDAPGETRVSVPIRGRTRAFFEAQAKQFNTSLAALTGATLDSVAAQEMESQGSTHNLITSRFYLLLREHGLSLPAAAEVLRDLNITAGDMSDANVLLNRLTTTNLAWIADHFCVSYEWLAGLSETIYSPTQGYWYKQPVTAAKRLMELAKGANHIDLCIVRVDGFDYESAVAKDDEAIGGSKRVPEFRPVVRIKRSAGPRETYTTYEPWEEGRWSYTRCRDHIKLATYFATNIRSRSGEPVFVTGVTVDAKTFGANVLLATTLAPRPAFDWHPDDFVEPESRVAKDTAEWLAIRNTGEYQGWFEAYDNLFRK